MSDQQTKNEQLRKAALGYHEHPILGKLAISATKKLLNQPMSMRSVKGC